MYSFGQRSDMIVYDEPLYAAYLVQTGTARPYREQVRCLLLSVMLWDCWQGDCFRDWGQHGSLSTLMLGMLHST